MSCGTRLLLSALTCSRCFFAGGLRFAEQTIKSTAAQLNSSLLLIAVIAVLIPSAFHFSITTSSTGEGLSLTNAQEGNDLLSMSHAVAILLLILYLGYLLFQMWTHAQFYEDDTVTGSSAYPAAVTDRVKRFTHRKKNDEESAFGSPTTLSTTETNPNGDVSVRVPLTELDNADGNGNVVSEDEDDEEQPQMNMWVTVVSPKPTRPALTADRHDRRYRSRRRHGRVPRQQHQWSGRFQPQSLGGMGRLDPSSDCECHRPQAVGGWAVGPSVKRHSLNPTPGGQRRRTLHRRVRLGQGQARPLHLSRGRLVHPDRAVRHTRDPAARLDHRQAHDPAV